MENNAHPSSVTIGKVISESPNFHRLPNILGRKVILTEDKFNSEGYFPKGSVLVIVGRFTTSFDGLDAFGYVGKGTTSNDEVLLGWDGFTLTTESVEQYTRKDVEVVEIKEKKPNILEKIIDKLFF